MKSDEEAGSKRGSTRGSTPTADDHIEYHVPCGQIKVSKVG